MSQLDSLCLNYWNADYNIAKGKVLGSLVGRKPKMVANWLLDKYFKTVNLG